MMMRDAWILGPQPATSWLIHGEDHPLPSWSSGNIDRARYVPEEANGGRLGLRELANLLCSLALLVSMTR